MQPDARGWLLPLLLVSFLAWAEPHTASAADLQGPGVQVGEEQTVQDLIAFGVPVYVAGTVTDIVIVLGGDLTLAATARIQHDVYVLGGTFVQDPDARVGGSVTVVSSAIMQALVAARGVGGAVLGGLLLLRLVLFLLIGVLAWQLAPTPFTTRQVQRLTARPLRTLGLGFLWATGLGMAAGVASLTLVGIPLGILLLGILTGVGTLGLAVMLAWIRQPGYVPLGGRHLVLLSLALLGLVPGVGEAILYGAAAVGLGVSLVALAEAHGTRLAALRTGQERW